MSDQPTERSFNEWIEEFGECPCSMEDCGPCPEHDRNKEKR